ncbi:hypothetical protein LAZ67_X000672 [Cordylochernes scorpioides]|uniref:Transposase n=1 Tax=Cordylochernes scorpioides TaxID=51811 RepID=A0ABY6LUD4_9ARAC|nr:hypothetical protein LAZ67_X000672 [Cordylochernes scorpioides]
MVCANRRITLEEIEDGLNEDCSHFSVHKIVSETLGYRKVSTREQLFLNGNETIGRIVTEDLKLKKTPAKFIPRFLTNEQKLCRLETCEDMLEMTRSNPEWKDKIITGDETWVYGYDPETKPQFAEWRGQGEPRPKKSRILKSRNKVLLVAFLDNKGIVHHEYLPAGQTVIKEMYLGILRRLREAIRKKKRPEKWTNDIAPNYFFLFLNLKAVLKEDILTPGMT